MFPMMPAGDPMSSPFPGPQANPGGPPPMDNSGGGLMGLLGGGSPQTQMLQVTQQIMAQFQQIDQLIQDLAAMLPGTEQVAADIAESMELWKRQAVMTMSQPAAAMPGASEMM